MTTDVSSRLVPIVSVIIDVSSRLIHIVNVIIEVSSRLIPIVSVIIDVSSRIGFTTFVSENLWRMAVAEFGSITGYF